LLYTEAVAFRKSFLGFFIPHLEFVNQREWEGYAVGNLDKILLFLILNSDTKHTFHMFHKIRKSAEIDERGI
jgi:hypothetical protein